MNSRQQPYCVGFPLSGSSRLIRPGTFRDANYSFTKATFSIAAVLDVLGIRRRLNISARRDGFIVSIEPEYINRIHTVGFESPRFFPLAPENAFFVHCNCLLRTPVERWEKIRKYEEIEPLSTLCLADEYLPELYDLAHHDAKRDGLEEFAELFDALPIQWSAALPKY